MSTLGETPSAADDPAQQAVPAAGDGPVSQPAAAAPSAFPEYGAYKHAPVERQEPGDPVRGLLAGAAVAIAGAIAWGLIVYLTKYEVGLLAVVIGYAVGYTVHRVGRIASQGTAIAAAVLAGAGILLGFLVTTVVAVASAFDLGFFEAASRITDTGSWGEALRDSVTGVDWFFLAIGAFSAYSLVTRSRSQRRR